MKIKRSFGTWEEKPFSTTDLPTINVSTGTGEWRPEKQPRSSSEPHLWVFKLNSLYGLDATALKSLILYTANNQDVVSVVTKLEYDKFMTAGLDPRELPHFKRIADELFEHADRAQDKHTNYVQVLRKARNDKATDLALLEKVSGMLAESFDPIFIAQIEGHYPGIIIKAGKTDVSSLQSLGNANLAALHKDIAFYNISKNGALPSEDYCAQMETYVSSSSFDEQVSSLCKVISGCFSDKKKTELINAITKRLPAAKLTADDFKGNGTSKLKQAIIMARPELGDKVEALLLEVTTKEQTYRGDYKRYLKGDQQREWFEQVKRVLTEAKSDRPVGAFLQGDVGQGKTHLSFAVAKELMSTDCVPIYLNPDGLTQAHGDLSKILAMIPAGKKAVWIIDGLNSPYGLNAETSLNLILTAKDRKDVVLITSNTPKEQLVDVLLANKAPTVAAAYRNVIDNLFSPSVQLQMSTEASRGGGVGAGR